jgi:hypothetical protein
MPGTLHGLHVTVYPVYHQRISTAHQGDRMKLITRVRDPFTGRRDIFIRLPFTSHVIMIGG